MVPLEKQPKVEASQVFGCDLPLASFQLPPLLLCRSSDTLHAPGPPTPGSATTAMPLLLLLLLLRFAAGNLA